MTSKLGLHAHTLGKLGSTCERGRLAAPVMLWWMPSLSFSKCAACPPLM